MVTRWQQKRTRSGKYKSHNGTVLRTKFSSSDAGSPAEHFIAVVFGRSTLSEVAFARLINGRRRMLDRVFTSHLRRRKSATK